MAIAGIEFGPKASHLATCNREILHGRQSVTWDRQRITVGLARTFLQGQHGRSTRSGWLRRESRCWIHCNIHLPTLPKICLAMHTIHALKYLGGESRRQVAVQS